MSVELEVDVERMIWREEEGRALSERVSSRYLALMRHLLTFLEVLILEGRTQEALDVIRSEVAREKAELESDAESESERFYTAQPSILLYAVLKRDLALVTSILLSGATALLTRGDYLTLFTPLHYALFVQHKEIFQLLLQFGAKIDQKDAYGATVMDYAAILRAMPSIWEEKEKSIRIPVYNPTTKGLDYWSASDFESNLGAKFISYYVADLHYIEELLFAVTEIALGLEVEAIDVEFREKFSSQMAITSGDENCFMAYISDQVGYGVFALRDIKEGEFVLRLVGKLTTQSQTDLDASQSAAEETLEDLETQDFEQAKQETGDICDERGQGGGRGERDYAIFTNLDGVIIDGRFHRNLGMMVNHSANPNTIAFADFVHGLQDVILVAKYDIPRGKQILWNYDLDYFVGDEVAFFVDMSYGDAFPSRITEMNF